MTKQQQHERRSRPVPLDYYGQDVDPHKDWAAQRSPSMVAWEREFAAKLGEQVKRVRQARS